jgi:hypothetical protein
MPSLLLPRNAGQTIDLSAFVGKTYLQTTFEANDGINAKTAADDATPVTIATTSVPLFANKNCRLSSY